VTGNGDTWKRTRLDLSQKVAVVTGGASGIGEATCYELANEGIRLVAVVDMADNVADFAAEGNAHFGRDVFVPFRGDVTDSSFRKRVFSELRSRHGAVSICVPAAGVTKDRLAVRINRDTHAPEIYPEEDFRRVIEIDLTAPIYWAMETIASVAEDRARQGKKRWEPSEPIQGCIIFIGSVSSAGNKGQISYATAKAGLEGAQATLAAEAMFHGVRSAIIHPGYTDTKMVAALGREFIAEHIIPHTQLRRLISPSEIAHAIVFMIQNSAVSGQLWVDAGWHPAV
jgi:NAD(P)-dependent dehydrogenase (short-subunit alcohol dehydrogenase family)